jgi:hypothetical protein
LITLAFADFVSDIVVSGDPALAPAGVMQAVTVAVDVTGAPAEVTDATFGRSTQSVCVAGTTKLALVGKVVVWLTEPSVLGAPPLNTSVTLVESPVTVGLPVAPVANVNGADAVTLIGVPVGSFHEIVAVFVCEAV